jgi:hypothetical protein
MDNNIENAVKYTAISPNSYREYIYLPMRSGMILYPEDDPSHTGKLFTTIDKMVNRHFCRATPDNCYTNDMHCPTNQPADFYAIMLECLRNLLPESASRCTISVKNAFDYYFWFEISEKGE